MTGHGRGGPLGLTVLVIGERGLRHEGTDARVVGDVGEVGELLVRDRELLSQRPESAADHPEAAFDQECHVVSVGTPLPEGRDG